MRQLLLPSVLGLAFAHPVLGQDAEAGTRKVRATVQPRPGAPEVEIDMPVHAAPVDPPLVPADEVELAGDALVLGVERGGEAVAFPIETLANFEVVNGRVSGLPVAPTW